MRYRVRIGWGDIDFARVIFWPRYFEYVEHAIGEWMLARGIRWQEFVAERQLGMPAVHVETRYYRPCRLQDLVEIELAIKDLTKKGCRFVFHIWHVDTGTLLASGQVTRRFIDNGAFRGIDLPDDLYERFLELARETAQVPDFPHPAAPTSSRSRSEPLGSPEDHQRR
jgi:YbgC/YbaW family acyl-CoA thioester hydrolase